MNNILIEFFASFLIYLMFFGLFILWFVDGKIKKEQVIHALFAAFVAWSITAIIKILFPTLRPFRANDLLLPLTLTVPGDSSFPSGHTAEAFAVAITIWLHDKKVGWMFLIMALTVGVFRVVANVHFPIDILGGALIGTLTAVIIEKVHFSELISKITRWHPVK